MSPTIRFIAAFYLTIDTVNQWSNRRYLISLRYTYAERIKVNTNALASNLMTESFFNRLKRKALKTLYDA